jgi:hypothetical protein
MSFAVPSAQADARHQLGGHNQQSHGNTVGVDVPGPSVRNPLDKLRLAGRIDLDPGEELVSSGKLDGDMGAVRVAVTRRDGQRSIRLATEPSGVGMPAWSGNRSRTAENHAERQRIDVERDRLDEESAEYERLTERLNALGEGDDWTTARLDEPAALRLSATLRGATDEAEGLARDDNARWDEIERLLERQGANYHELVAASGDEAVALQAERDRNFRRIEELTAAHNAARGGDPLGYIAVAEGDVVGEWATVEYQVFVDEAAAQVVLVVRPDGAPEGWDNGIDRAVFDLAELRKILRLLDAGGGTGKGSVRTAKRFDPRQPRDTDGQWVDVPGIGGLVGHLADILDDISFDTLGGDEETMYVGIRGDGTMDLGVGNVDGATVHFSYRDVDKISDGAFGMWRQRGGDGNEDGLIDDTIVETSGGRIYLAISEKQIYEGDPDDPDDLDEFGPVLTVGIPTAEDTEDDPDFHELDLDEDGFDNLIKHLEALRDNHPPAEVETEGVGDYDVSLLSDHTIQLLAGGDAANPPELRIDEADQLAAAIDRLLTVDLPKEPVAPEDADTLDGEDINDDLGVSLLTDGTFSVLMPTGDSIELDRDDAGQFAETLRTLVRRDRTLPGGSGIPARSGADRAAANPDDRWGAGMPEAPVTTKTSPARRARADMPYGDVTYADPGYQSDGKKRYPLDSERHCRAAWSYINMPGNAAKYTPEQVKRIKGRIKAAGEKYGISFAAESGPTRSQGVGMPATDVRHLKDLHDQSKHGRRGPKAAVKAAGKDLLDALNGLGAPPEGAGRFADEAKRDLRAGKPPRDVAARLREVQANHQERLADLASELDAAEGTSGFDDIETEHSREASIVRFLGAAADAVDGGPPPRRRRPRRSAGVAGLCVRAFDFDTRATRSGNGRRLEGYAAVYGKPARIRDLKGDFEETIRAGAFTRSLAERTPVMQWEHGRDPRVGAVPIAQVLDLDDRRDGLYVAAELYDNPVIEPIRQAIVGGSVKGMSFRFEVPAGGDDWRRDGRVERREVTDADVHEFGPVVFPAYDTTSVGVRSLLAAMDPAEIRELVHELAGHLDRAVDLTALDGRGTDLTGGPAQGAGRGDHDQAAEDGVRSTPIDPRTRDRVLRAFGVLTHA